MPKLTLWNETCGIRAMSPKSVQGRFLVAIMLILLLLATPAWGQAQKRSPQDVVRELDAALKEYDKKIADFTQKRDAAKANYDQCVKTINYADKRFPEIQREKAAIQKAWPNHPSKWANLDKEHNQLKNDRAKALDKVTVYSNQRAHFDDALRMLKHKRNQLQMERNAWASKLK